MATGKPRQAKRAASPKAASSRKAASRPRTQKSGRTGKQVRSRAKAAARTTSKRAPQMWSAAVTRGSNAMDLEPNVFNKSSPRAVALSLKRSAEQSRRRKAAPFQSAMSMLNFYINRAGHNLPKARLRVLERAKGELRKAFGRD